MNSHYRLRLLLFVISTMHQYSVVSYIRELQMKCVRLHSGLKAFSLYSVCEIGAATVAAAASTAALHCKQQQLHWYWMCVQMRQIWTWNNFDLINAFCMTSVSGLDANGKSAHFHMYRRSRSVIGVSMQTAAICCTSCRIRVRIFMSVLWYWNTHGRTTLLPVQTHIFINRAWISFIWYF